MVCLICCRCGLSNHVFSLPSTSSARCVSSATAGALGRTQPSPDNWSYTRWTNTLIDVKDEPLLILMLAEGFPEVLDDQDIEKLSIDVYTRYGTDIGVFIKSPPSLTYTTACDRAQLSEVAIYTWCLTTSFSRRRPLYTPAPAPVPSFTPSTPTPGPTQGDGL